MNPALKRFIKMQILVLIVFFLLSLLTVTVYGALNVTSHTNNTQGNNSVTGLGATGNTTQNTTSETITQTLTDFGGYAMGAGLAIGLAGLGAGVGMGTASSAIVGAISEKPEMFGRSFIFVILIEAIAIYGLVISFILIGKLP